ncbi:MAG: UDP-2,3-diacylglucosamine diphosphatase [Burkholderiaceae bacterium]|jgi:UDP-2,3-diacylglucosamine hydrolase|nr:MAG: UDP-2,3-diacylglucosamine diphosphatase [Burkholderiaceae bacterium]
MTLAVPAFAERAADAGWARVEFASDLHLRADDPATVQAWQHYLQRCDADALFILGDLFELWIGDDAAGDFELGCADALRAAAAHRPLFFMHGNRDFLVGSRFLDSCKVVLLADPTVLGFAGQRWLLSHGDALCLDDTEYLAYREQVRDPIWQRDFLAKPVAERRAIAQTIRVHSETRKRTEGYGDVDANAARRWLQAARATTLIHGHTHRPADHDLGGGLRRVVLSDWDAQDRPPRAEVLRLDETGRLERITPPS